MQLALLTTFAASRKEPLAEVLERIHAALIAADFGEPHVQFVMADPMVGGVSSVARVIKRFPSLERFVKTMAPSPAVGTLERKVISNRTSSGAPGEAVDFAVLIEIARGVPRSFPFHNVGIHFSVPAFSRATETPSTPRQHSPGISVSDSWWVNGRMRSVSALTLVEADPAARKLPALPESIATVLAACGKVKKTIQAPLVMDPAAAQRPSIDTVSPEKAAAIRAVVQDYRARTSEILDRASLPHDLPPNQEALALGVTSGPKKPALVRAFTPMGYDCRSESAGSFTLRRRTPNNLTAEIRLDVGTWSNNVIALFRVQGLIEGIGFKASMIMPVSRRAVLGGQYPIGGPERWQQIVDNLAALVAELDRTFVPEIEAISGPSPDWYKPETDRTG